MTPEAIRVLRWIYTRDTTRLTCELGLGEEGLVYELRTTGRDRLLPQTIERFRFVGAAFERQCEMEGHWLDDGWSLESYESVVRPLAASPADANR
jgi:hypothetical protein